MNVFENFDLKEMLKERGTKKIGYVPFARKANGSWVNIPVMIATGKYEGKTILADGCCHGDEYEGSEGVCAAFHAVDVENMHGNLIVVPAVNLDAFGAMDRFNNNDFVPSDMNRIFPGNEKGYLTHALANYYLNEFIKNVDGTITMHGGGNTLYLHPVTCFQDMGDELSAKSMEMAKAFGFSYLWADNGITGTEGFEDATSYLNGVPCITPEIGGQATRLHHRDEHIEMIKEGVINVMRLFEIIEEPVKTFDDQYYLNLEYIYCKHGGVHKPQLKGGEEFKEGDVLSIIYDVFGNEVDRVLAPCDGVVVGFLTYSVINPRSWSYLIGKNVKKA